MHQFCSFPLRQNAKCHTYKRYSYSPSSLLARKKPRRCKQTGEANELFIFAHLSSSIFLWRALPWRVASLFVFISISFNHLLYFFDATFLNFSLLPFCIFLHLNKTQMLIYRMRLLDSYSESYIGSGSNGLWQLSQVYLFLHQFGPLPIQIFITWESHHSIGVLMLRSSGIKTLSRNCGQSFANLEKP